MEGPPFAESPSPPIVLLPSTTPPLSIFAFSRPLPPLSLSFLLSLFLSPSLPPLPLAYRARPGAYVTFSLLFRAFSPLLTRSPTLSVLARRATSRRDAPVLCRFTFLESLEHTESPATRHTNCRRVIATESSSRHRVIFHPAGRNI